MELYWWHWVITGIVLVGLELVIPSFTIIWFGFGALLVGAIIALIPISLAAMITTWILTSVTFMTIWFLWAKRQKTKSAAGTADASIGEIGMVIVGAEPPDKGKVQFYLPLMGSYDWPCCSKERLETGDRVKVAEVVGHILLVEKLTKE